MAESEIIFIYKGYEVPIQCNPGEKMKNIMERLYTKINVTKNDIYALHNGQLLNEEINEDQIPKNQNNKKIILVYKYTDTTINNKVTKTSNEVICPICKEICLIEIKDYKITLYNCKKGHNSNIFIKEFNESQNINLSDIICNICKERNKGNTHNNEFYRCLNCKFNICPLCKSNHNNNHNIINYDQINYICNEHNEQYFEYCLKCKKNICTSCENDHIDHDIISHGRMLRKKKEILEKNNILKNNIDKFKIIIQEIIKKLNIVLDNIEKYYEINKNIIDNINNKNRNYEMLFNINNINNDNINDDIKNIIDESDINVQFQNIMKLYSSMNKKSELQNINENKKETKNELKNINKSQNINKPKNEIIIKYKINKGDTEINIFGLEFVINNKNICKYIYEGKEYELSKTFNLNNYDKSKDILEIKLTGIQNVTNMSSLFYLCFSLISIPDISEWDTSNITNMSFIFCACNSLMSLPDISKWNTSNVTDMACMFSCCISLKSLPDISSWNTSKNKSLFAMFNNCESLISLPDISKWDISKVEKMNEIFYNCSSLISLPDISKWDIKNVKEMKDMFQGCQKSLKISSKFQK